MDANWKLVALGVALLVVAGGALLGVVDLLDAPDGRSPGGDGSPTSAPAPAEGGGGDGDRDGGEATPTEQPPFDMDVESVEPCGRTCRDVTATLENNQDRAATGVTVSTTIYAGDDTGGNVVWEGTRDVGTLGPGASATDTTRIELGFFDAAAVEASGGEITIELVVETDRRTVRFVEHRDVA